MRWLWLLVLAMACHPADAPSSNPTRIDEVAWLEGDWGGDENLMPPPADINDGRSAVGTRQGIWTEEHWSTARGATMLGTNRSVRDDKTVFFEFLQIEASPLEVTYWAAPRGQSPTPFRLVKVEGQKASFYNPNHDYPQWIVYERSGSLLKVHIEGIENGRPNAHDWTWHRL